MGKRCEVKHCQYHTYGTETNCEAIPLRTKTCALRADFRTLKELLGDAVEVMMYAYGTVTHKARDREHTAKLLKNLLSKIAEATEGGK